MGCEQLSLASFIKEMKEVSDGPHPRKFCFVLGAGASRTSGIKSGQELVRIWDKELRSRNESEYYRWRKELDITDENMSSFYSQYYEKRFQRCRTDGYNYIEKIMDSAKPSAGYVMLAHLLTKTPHNVVITTNFDHLTEDAVNYYAQSTPLVIGHEALAHYVSGQPVRPTIIKIHRDLLFDPKSRAEDLEKLPDSWKTALELIFENYHPVFIGYAGNDKSLMDFLVENGEKFTNDEWKFPYWMLYGTDKVEGKVKKFLEISEGYFSYHDGFDDVMIQIGAAFDYTIPAEQEFLEDARKRYKALADAIDAFSDEDKESNKADAAMIYLDPPKNKTEDDKQEVNQAIQKITNQSEMQRMYREASTLIRETKYDEAETVLSRLVELDPKNPRYFNSLAHVQHRVGKIDSALAMYKKAIELEPHNDTHHVDMAMMLRMEDRNEEALAAIQKAVEVNPEEELNVYIMGLMYESLEEYEQALWAFQKTVELMPDSAINHYKAAQMAVQCNQLEEALERIRTAITFDSNEVDYYECLHGILRRLGKQKEAESIEVKITELREQKNKQGKPKRPNKS